MLQFITREQSTSPVRAVRISGGYSAPGPGCSLCQMWPPATEGEPGA